MTAITPTPMPTQKALVPAASSPIGFPAAASDADFNTIGTATGTSTGTTSLTIAGASGNFIFPGSAVTGTGVPANTVIVSQTSGTPGGNGVYKTNNNTTLASIALTINPSEPIDPAGNSPPIVVNPATVIPGEPLSKTASANTYTLALPTFRSPLIPLTTTAGTFNKSNVPPFIGGTYPYLPTPPASLAFNRSPAFPGYP